jgi:hypothetical protein
MSTQSVYFMHYSDAVIYCSSCKSIGATTTGHGKSQTHKIIQTEYYPTSAFILTSMARWEEDEDNREEDREKNA